ncbi:OprD family outer membrane porin [Serratia sp. M24T3]|uniref:OprD family outer membrane porin n=1 Tax=Serratia sp. M24T3 TaxID=932213 RepID=UPI00025BBEC9|nr:outer membrane porin [Serratia sp. M24T3]
MKKILPLTLLAALCAQSAYADTTPSQASNNGFIADSHLDLLFRNAFIDRNYRGNTETRDEWGQAAILNFTSGFTQGPVGFGFDALGQYAVRLDGGWGQGGGAGIDFFSQNQDGQSKNDLEKIGGRAKMRVSKTVLSYGTQAPVLPILNADSSRLLDETYTGVMLDSQEIDGLDVTAGHFTAEQQKSSNKYNSGLHALTFGGASYQFNDRLSGSIYASNVESVLSKQYLGMTYTQPLAPEHSLIFDFNGYNSHLNKGYAESQDTGRHNDIWSFATSYVAGMHTFKIAYQQSTGSTGYNYGGYGKNGGVGDGGNSIYVSNSYWSDFNGKGERSIQLAYSADLGKVGLPGLTYDVAYVTADNIETAETNNGHEHELFNQIQYKVPSGVAKNLKIKLRYSILRVSADASSYNVGGNEVRVFVEYPLSIF